MPFSIRNVNEADLASVLALNESEVPHVGSIDTESLLWFAAHAAYFRVAIIDDDLAGFLIALRPGTSYGSLNYRWFCERYDDFAYIDRVTVSTAHRRRGVARGLYDDLAARMHEQVPVLTCEVNLRPANPDSLHFHEKLGFEQVGEQDTEGGSKTVALLARRLGSA